MTAIQFIRMQRKKAGKDYGVCPPPTAAQEALNVLCGHFLGEGWCTSMPIEQEQVNTQIVCEILNNYPRKKTLKERFLGLIGRARDGRDQL